MSNEPNVCKRGMRSFSGREALHKSALPEKEREMMSQALDREVEMLTPKTRPLLPPEDMVEK
ncbi:MAG: hypothetical protein L0Y75_00195 [Acidobacteria bacterium]|nr:hypothetical protein [Acidobacteriota bacterium]